MSGFRGVPTAELAKLCEALRAGLVSAPVARVALDAMHLPGLISRSETFKGLDEQATLALLEVVLDERATPRATIDLVWSGPEGKSGWASPTAEAVRVLFDKAERSVLLAGYSFDHGEEILQPLHTAISTRRASVDIYLHVATARKDVKDLDDHVQNEVARFLTVEWPWTPKPHVFVDPRTAAPASAGHHASLHAKCIVVDERWSLVGSANFTNRGQSRNIEVGALIDDVGFARAIVAQFRAATADGVFRSWLS